MTTGLRSGTSGDPPIGPWASVAAASLLVVSVNATSVMLEARGEDGLVWWEPVLWEGSSALVLIAMAPMVGRAIRRWPLGRDRLVEFLLTHLALTVPFSVAHVVAVAAMRSAVYALAGRGYAFFEDGIALRLLYEWRKDALVYGAIALVFWWFDTQPTRRAGAAIDDGRIEIRHDGGAVYLAAPDILFVQAAGNYVTFHTAVRAYLVRGALADWQARLAPRGFVRAHRSHLVNRGRISAVRRTPAGDLRIILDNGYTVLGSRRYRAALSATPQA